MPGRDWACSTGGIIDTGPTMRSCNARPEIADEHEDIAGASRARVRAGGRGRRCAAVARGLREVRHAGRATRYGRERGRPPTPRTMRQRRSTRWRAPSTSRSTRRRPVSRPRRRPCRRCPRAASRRPRRRRSTRRRPRSSRMRLPKRARRSPKPARNSSSGASRAPRGPNPRAVNDAGLRDPQNVIIMVTHVAGCGSGRRRRVSQE